MLAYAAMALPMFFVDDTVQIELFNPAEGLALTLLFGVTAWAAYNLGGIMTTLAYLDGDDGAVDSRLYRVAPPPGEPGPMTPSRVFTAGSTGIGSATGVLVAIALEQLLGAPRGLTIL